MNELLEYLRDGLDRERAATREQELPGWALTLPQGRQRQILQAQRMALRGARERYDDDCRQMADAIFYGARR